MIDSRLKYFDKCTLIALVICTSFFFFSIQASATHRTGCCSEYFTPKINPNEATELTSFGVHPDDEINWLVRCLEWNQPCCHPTHGAPRYVILSIIAAHVIGFILVTGGIFLFSSNGDDTDNSTLSDNEQNKDIIIVQDENAQIQCPNGKLSLGFFQTAKYDTKYQSSLDNSAKQALEYYELAPEKKYFWTNTLVFFNRIFCEGYIDSESMNTCSSRLLKELTNMKEEDALSLTDYILALTLHKKKNKAILQHDIPDFLLTELDSDSATDSYITASGYICSKK